MVRPANPESFIKSLRLFFKIKKGYLHVTDAYSKRKAIDTFLAKSPVYKKMILGVPEAGFELCFNVLQRMAEITITGRKCLTKLRTIYSLKHR